MPRAVLQERTTQVSEAKIILAAKLVLQANTAAKVSAIIYLISKQFLHQNFTHRAFVICDIYFQRL